MSTQTNQSPRTSGQATSGVPAGSGAGSLRYPAAMDANNDYMSFRHSKYRTNGGSPNSVGGGAAAPSEGATIVLYMPNSTPVASNTQSYQEWSAPGPLGDFRRELGYIAGNAVQELDVSSVESATGKSITDIASRVGAGWEAHKQKMGPAIRQVGMNVAGAVAGTSAANLLATTKGKVYNPNIEFIYQAPQRRSFSFSFNFVPTSQQETDTVNQIIYEFKKWSTPHNLENGMYEVPHIWEVNYFSGGRESQYMNLFKKMALVGISVQDNPTQNMHMTFPDGMPVVKSMTLSFQEVDVITRNDLEEGLGTSAVSF